MKPMLSAALENNADIEALRYPVLVSPKLDGIRCLLMGAQAVSRNLKPIPNASVQDVLSKIPACLDGELIVGDPKAKDCYRRTNSGVMSRDGEPDWVFWVFDIWDSTREFSARYAELKAGVRGLHPRIRLVPHVRINSAEALHKYEAQHIVAGYEGIMVRSLDGPYKYGRSTRNEGYLYKLKRFSDSEAVIIGYDEQMHNANEAKLDKLGRTERSSHKANKIPKSTLGALKVRDIHSGVEFDIGTGFTDAERHAIWVDREGWLGRVVKYKFLPVGVKDKPRHPVYLGPRADL